MVLPLPPAVSSPPLEKKWITLEPLLVLSLVSPKSASSRCRQTRVRSQYFIITVRHCLPASPSLSPRPGIAKNPIRARRRGTSKLVDFEVLMNILFERPRPLPRPSLHAVPGGLHPCTPWHPIHLCTTEGYNTCRPFTWLLAFLICYYKGALHTAMG